MSTPRAEHHGGRSLPFFKCRVERAAAGGEVLLLDEGAGFAGAELTVHAAVFPFDGERALIADAVELADDLFEVNASAAGAAEIPPAARVAEIEVTGEDARAAVERDDGV